MLDDDFEETYEPWDDESWPVDDPTNAGDIYWDDETDQGEWPDLDFGEINETGQAVKGET